MTDREQDSEAHLPNLNSRVDRLEGKVSQLEKQLGHLPASVDALSNTVKDGMAALASKIDRINDPDRIREDERYRTRIDHITEYVQSSKQELWAEVERIEDESKKRDESMTEALDDISSKTNRMFYIGVGVIGLITLIGAIAQMYGNFMGKAG